MHIDRMWNVVESYEKGVQPADINDYLEMYQIVLFVEHEVYPTGWDEKRIESIKQYKGKIAAFFSKSIQKSFHHFFQKAGRDLWRYHLASYGYLQNQSSYY